MAKRGGNSRKPRGAAGIEIIEGESDRDSNGSAHEMPESSEASPPRPARSGKKSDPSSTEQVGIGDIRKAAAFVNSVGGLDKAIALLQILKVAKEVQ